MTRHPGSLPIPARYGSPRLTAGSTTVPKSPAGVPGGSPATRNAVVAARRGQRLVVIPWWLRGFALDLRSLALFRIVIGLCLLGSLIRRLSEAATFYSGAGVLPAQASASRAGEHLQPASHQRHGGDSVRDLPRGDRLCDGVHGRLPHPARHVRVVAPVGVDAGPKSPGRSRGGPRAQAVALLGDVPAAERRVGGRQAAGSSAHPALPRHRRADPADRCGVLVRGGGEDGAGVAHRALGGLLRPPYRHGGYAAGRLAARVSRRPPVDDCREPWRSSCWGPSWPSHPGGPTPAASRRCCCSWASTWGSGSPCGWVSLPGSPPWRGSCSFPARSGEREWTGRHRIEA